MSRSTRFRSQELSRRDALGALALAGGATLTGAVAPMAPGATGRKDHRARELAARAAALPITDPAFNVRTLGRLQGDLSGRTIWSFGTGRVFGLLPGDAPPLSEYGRLLYRTDSVAVRMSRQRADGAIEDRSRNWMFYKDPDTNAYLSEFRNPYTGETVPVPTFRGGISGGVMTVAGPEYSANFSMESTVFGKPLLLDWRFVGEHAFINRHAFTRWKEGATGLHKTEMTLDTWVCRIEDVANPKLTRIPNTYAWTSQTEWQSWLKMRGHAGAMLWRNEGLALDSIDALPADFVAQSEKAMPGKLAEPLTWG